MLGLLMPGAGVATMRLCALDWHWRNGPGPWFVDSLGRGMTRLVVGLIGDLWGPSSDTGLAAERTAHSIVVRSTGERQELSARAS